MSSRFTQAFTARKEHIDVMGHVNNAVWVQWMESIATAHWEADALPEHVAAYAWVVTRHEIDYRGNIREGETVIAETFIKDGPSGARFNRYVAFRNEADKVIVSAKSTWAMIDRNTSRVQRVPQEVAAAFLPEQGSGQGADKA